MRIVSCDIGGTHARFCAVEIDAGGAVRLDAEVTLKTAEHQSFEAALRAFADQRGLQAIDALAIAFAGPVRGTTLKLTNSHWQIERNALATRLGVERLTIVNDFGAVAHAVATLPHGSFQHLCGPDRPLPDAGVVSIVGPGTGLGAAILLREGGGYRVIETEAGHIGFAPTDTVEEEILTRLRERFGRVSVERLASGAGLAAIYAALTGAEPIDDERALWAAALDGGDEDAATALDRFCLVLGSAAGDLALAQGAQAVVIAGGLGRRLSDRLPASGFAERFTAKGRYRAYMEALPVKLVTHPEPGLYGAAAAFAQEHC